MRPPPRMRMKWTWELLLIGNRFGARRFAEGGPARAGAMSRCAAAAPCMRGVREKRFPAISVGAEPALPPASIRRPRTSCPRGETLKTMSSPGRAARPTLAARRRRFPSPARVMHASRNARTLHAPRPPPRIASDRTRHENRWHTELLRFRRAKVSIFMRAETSDVSDPVRSYDAPKMAARSPWTAARARHASTHAPGAPHGRQAPDGRLIEQAAARWHVPESGVRYPLSSNRQPILEGDIQKPPKLTNGSTH